MRLALDTNRYVDLCKGVENTVRLVSTAEAVFLPFVVVGELRAGFAFGKRTAENERVLRRFLLKEGVAVLYADDQTTHHYAAAYRQLRHQGDAHPDQRPVDRRPGAAAQPPAPRPRPALRAPAPDPPGLSAGVRRALGRVPLDREAVALDQGGDRTDSSLTAVLGWSRFSTDGRWP